MSALVRNMVPALMTPKPKPKKPKPMPSDNDGDEPSASDLANAQKYGVDPKRYTQNVRGILRARKPIPTPKTTPMPKVKKK